MIEMNYTLSKADEKGFRLGKAQTAVTADNEQQEFEALFRIHKEFKNGGLEWAQELLAGDLSLLENIIIHPTLLTQLLLILAGAELIFHRDNPKDKKEFRYHTVGFHYNMLMDSFVNLSSEKKDALKPARQYKGKVLKGLWYKHVDDASISGMATNILNELKNDDWLMKAFIDRFGPFDGTQLFNDEHSRFLAHHATVVSQQRRIERKEMTGEWIVFQKLGDKIQLLTLASHQEDDARILGRFKV